MPGIGLINATTLELAWKLTLLVVAVFWLGLAFWVYRDARRRIDDGMLVGTATALGLVPFLGPLVYLLFRPPETLDDVALREAEVRALEARVASAPAECPVCRTHVERDFLVCPVCTTRLKLACAGCEAPLEPLWQMCPWCATPVSARADLDAALTAETRSSSRGKEREPGRAGLS